MYSNIVGNNFNIILFSCQYNVVSHHKWLLPSSSSVLQANGMYDDWLQFGSDQGSSDEDALSIFLPEANGETPRVWYDEEDEGVGAEGAKVDRALTLLLLNMLVPGIEPSVIAFGAGGFSISEIPSSICTTFPIIGL